MFTDLDEELEGLGYGEAWAAIEEGVFRRSMRAKKPTPSPCTAICVTCRKPFLVQPNGIGRRKKACSLRCLPSQRKPRKEIPKRPPIPCALASCGKPVEQTRAQENRYCCTKHRKADHMRRKRAAA